MKEQRDQLSRRVDHNLPLVPPWDDPADDVWENAIIEIPKEYREYISGLGLGSCHTYATDKEMDDGTSEE